MVTAESLVITAILIAPGFVAVLIGITLGVVEREIGRDEFYLSSLISSLLIGVVFIWFIQIQWAYQITHPAELTDIFFGEQEFNVAAAVLMIVLSLAFGLIYGIGLTYNFPHFFRDRIVLFRSHRRNPWQPWVGGLRDAEQVMIQRGGGSDVVGILAEYSRAEKERQILLVSPRFLDFEDAPNRERVLIPENEIMMVHILSTKKRKGAGSQIGETIKRIWGVLPGSETDTPVEENASE